MSCYCEDAEPCEVWDERRRRAAKAHRCYECKETIEPKDEYLHISTLHDRRWSAFTICEYCAHDWRVLRDLGHCQQLGRLQETWEETWRKHV